MKRLVEPIVAHQNRVARLGADLANGSSIRKRRRWSTTMTMATRPTITPATLAWKATTSVGLRKQRRKRLFGSNIGRNVVGRMVRETGFMHQKVIEKGIQRHWINPSRNGSNQ